MGKAIRSASKDSLISAYSKERSHGKTFGFHKMMDIAGELSGAFIIYLILTYVSHNESIIRDIFMYTAIPGIIATIIVIFFVKDVPYKKAKKIIVISEDDKQLYPILFLYFMFIFFIMSEQFFILYAKNIGYTLADIPLFIMLFTLVQTLISYYGGILSDKLGLFYTLGISFLLGLFAVFMLKVNLWVSFVSLGFFTVISLNALRAYISEHAISKGYVFGILYAGIALFSSLGALVIGYIWKFYGFEYVYIFSILGMMVILIFYILKPSKVIV
jgi:MFS family permease